MFIIANTSLKFVTFFHQQTPLHVAANKGHDYTVECLAKKGAYMNIQDKEGVSEKLYLWASFSSADLSLNTWLLT